MQQTWSTHLVAAPQRAEFWRAAVCEAFLAMTPRIAPRCDFRARLDHAPIDRLALNRVRAPAHGVLRTPLDLGRTGGDYLFVNLNRQGRGRLRQSGREHLTRPGQLMLIDSSATYELDELDDDGDLLSLCVPASALGDRAARLRDRVARPAPDLPAARLLAAQVDLLAAHAHELPPTAAAAMADSLLALLPVAFDAGPADPPHGRLSVRLRTLVMQHFHDPDYGAAEAAREAGVSLRSLQAALAREGTSFGALLLAHRLQRAHAWLAGAGAAVRIADIAERCGFRSPEHFARCFRMRYGMTPTACRSR